ncbi:guanine nucleotide-binding protein G(I)/G(S)/G(O) subunit gamma-10-like [Ursus arctos]|uniref:guanine nucleotide-binding protein G(I)/G(S)/G(O) subunit gamma-10-like n=1 Tax=Ursus arctos TaxID=9644 RepID=UPI00201763B1|nr:guanine nucleotide-binding protein G(I)/G(S)/G(O) subunit gamma-10-like [Ursus arctos]
MEFKGTVSDPSLSSADLCPRVVLGELVTYELHTAGTWRAALLSGGSSSSLLRDLAEQFKLEASVERIKVLQASAELQYYCMQSACKEAPLVGIPAGSKPFWKPRSCALF